MNRLGPYEVGRTLIRLRRDSWCCGVCVLGDFVVAFAFVLLLGSGFSRIAGGCPAQFDWRIRTC